MASEPTSAKRQRTEDPEILGYIHSVTPVKQAKNGKTSYFNAVFQERDGFTDMVCFSPEKHQVMLDYNKSKSPVQLKSADRVPSNRKAGKFDLKFNYKTELIGVNRSLNFRYEVPLHEEISTVQAVIDNINAYNKLSFSRGNTFTVLKKSTEDWWWVESDGCYGYVPVNHITTSSQWSWEDDEYFGQYGELKLHHEMLSDRPRTRAYQTAIQKNAEQLRDRVIIDLGCGTGILSLMCAKYGQPKMVYAVEASDMADHTQKIVEVNGFSDVISVVKQYAEDMTLDEKVDVIISEWMGTVLLFEMMVESVILAREKFLRDDGVMWPSTAHLHLVPCSAAEAHHEKSSFWEEQYGFSFSPLKQVSEADALQKPVPCHKLRPEDCLSTAQEVFSLDMKTVSVDDLEENSTDFCFVVKRDGTLHGFCTWFSVCFRGLDDNVDDVTLSTGPESEVRKKNLHSEGGRFFIVLPEAFAEGLTLKNLALRLTHWRQNLFLLNDSLEVLTGDVLDGTFILSRNKEWRRHLKARVKFDLRREKTVMVTVEKYFNIWR